MDLAHDSECGFLQPKGYHTSFQIWFLLVSHLCLIYVSLSDRCHCTDDENVMIDNSVLSKLGTIEVIVTRAIRLPSSNSAINWHPHVPNNIGPLHEKSKKVGGHCVS
jgi:hypothetical protein